MNENVKKKIIEKAIFLEKHGINDVAWKKEDAETLIKSIMKDKIGILGGDVVTSQKVLVKQPDLDEVPSEAISETLNLPGLFEKLRDVYNLASERLQPTYDNWFCEINKGEAQEKYYLRSKVESLKYVENYLTRPEEKIVFSITFTEDMK
jgi:hypothetical protein